MPEANVGVEAPRAPFTKPVSYCSEPLTCWQRGQGEHLATHVLTLQLEGMPAPGFEPMCLPALLTSLEGVLASRVKLLEIRQIQKR